MEGSYKHLDGNKYSFEMELLVCESTRNQASCDGVKTIENTKISGGLYYENHKLYYLDDASDIDNYQNCP